MKDSIKGVALVVLMTVACARAAEAQVAPRTDPLPNLRRVNERLYRGAQPREGGFERLAALGVKTILNLRDDDEHALAEGRAVQAAGLRYFNVPLKSYSRPDDEEMERALSVIEDPDNQPVFVHCKRGADRTGTVVAVYRIRHDNWTAADALHEARARGLRWVQFEMKDYIADAYRRRLQRDNLPLTHLDDSKTQVAGTTAAAARVAVEKSYLFSRRGLKHLSRMVP